MGEEGAEDGALRDERGGWSWRWSDEVDFEQRRSLIEPGLTCLMDQIKTSPSSPAVAR